MSSNKEMKVSGLRFITWLIMLFLFYSCKKEITITQKIKPEVVIAPGDSRLSFDDIHFVKDTVYIIATDIIRNTSQTFTIDAGTLIKVKNKIAITINPGGQILANGTKSEPVIFTSTASKGGGGQIVNTGASDQNFWYGISITGSEGKSSGNMNFVRIEFAGGSRSIPGEAALSLTEVDKLTIIQNIQVSYCFETPSFDFSGGNCNASKLVSYACVNSDFIIENGYKGMLQNLLVYRHPYFASSCDRGCNGIDLAGLIIKDDNSFPLISNLTVLGPGIQTGTGKKYSDTTSITPSPIGNIISGSRVGGVIIRGGKFIIRNTVLSGFPKGGFYLDNRASAVALNNNYAEFTYSLTESNDSSRAFFLTPGVYPPYTSADFKQFILRPQYHNRQFYNLDDFGFTDPFNYDINPNLLPRPGSPVLSGANFDGADTFFQRVDYIGALGTDNWMEGWVNFIPLQTDYNN